MVVALCRWLVSRAVSGAVSGAVTGMMNWGPRAAEPAEAAGEYNSATRRDEPESGEVEFSALTDGYPIPDSAQVLRCTPRDARHVMHAT